MRLLWLGLSYTIRFIISLKAGVTQGLAVLDLHCVGGDDMTRIIGEESRQAQLRTE